MFRTTAQLRHKSAVPANSPSTKGIAMLHDHEFFIRCDPHMTKYEALPAQTSSDPTPTAPSNLNLAPIAPPKFYTVTDRIHALPAGLWDSDVVSKYEFFDLENGVFIRVHSPMGIVIETIWQISEVEGGNTHELVEDITIQCSRVLVGTVKSSCESGWKGVHGKMLDRLRDAS